MLTLGRATLVNGEAGTAFRHPEPSSSSATTTRERRFGGESCLGDELQRVDVERLIRDDPLQLGVLLLELLQALGVVGLHAALLIALAVSGRFGDFESPTSLGHVAALVEQLLAFGEILDHLLGCMTPLLLGVLLTPFWSISTRIASSSVREDLSKPLVHSGAFQEFLRLTSDVEPIQDSPEYHTRLLTTLVC